LSKGNSQPKLDIKFVYTVSNLVVPETTGYKESTRKYATPLSILIKQTSEQGQRASSLRS